MAVEAARAGVAGAGFAVAVEEVRNLALRASNAAKDTAALIEQSSASIEEGMVQASSVNKAFSEVQEIADKISIIIEEVAAGSIEQSQGIDQLNKAVQEIDKIVQHNAATAEESSASADELNTQSRVLNVLLDKLAQFLDVGERTTIKSQKSANTFRASSVAMKNVHRSPTTKPFPKYTSKTTAINKPNKSVSKPSVEAFVNSFDLDDEEMDFGKGSFKDF